MPDQHDLDPDPRAECASNVEKNDPYPKLPSAHPSADPLCT